MFIYNIAIALMGLGIRIASGFNHKAKLMTEGYTNIFSRLKRAVDGQDKILWMHSASLGEFEQGRPILEEVKKQYPDYKVLVTFFSPSGYEIRKNYKGADWVFYMPIDTRQNAKRFVEIVKPKVAIFIKYEFWLNSLHQLHLSGCNTYLVSAIFRKNSIFFSSYGAAYRRALREYTGIFVQNDESVALLKELGVESVKAGDTRFDRVVQIAKEGRVVEVAERFVANHKVFIAGSTWERDEELLLSLCRKWRDIKFIIAPHQIEQHRIDKMVADAPYGAVRYTQCNENSNFDNTQILIIDTIGILSALYRYADFSYIGGGFGVGIHNTLEAATFGLPIAFGPKYEKFQEAKDMIALGCASSVATYEELEQWLEPLVVDQQHYKKICSITQEYVKENVGATEKIVSQMKLGNR